MPLTYTSLPVVPLCLAAVAAVTPHAQERNVRLLPHIDLETPVVWGDETAIRCILDNLLMNAVGILPPGSPVLLRVSAPESG